MMKLVNKNKVRDFNYARYDVQLKTSFGVRKDIGAGLWTVVHSRIHQGRMLIGIRA